MSDQVEEIELSLQQDSNTTMQGPDGTRVMERIERLISEQAGQWPDAVAVEFNGMRLSYSELQRESLQISQALTLLGLRPGRVVGIYQERSLATIPLLLGIWHAGGIVVPMNPNMPDKMLEWLIQDCSPSVIVTDRGLQDRIVRAAANIDSKVAPIVLQGGVSSNGNQRENLFTLAANLQKPVKDSEETVLPADTCYIIYTSGSEGRPKGVMGSHKSLVQYVNWQVKELSITGADRFSQIAPLSFDFSLKELFVPLVCGACVCMADRTAVMDTRKFLKWVYDSKITVMCCVPTLLRSILQLTDDTNGSAFQSLRYLLISGETLRWDDVFSWRTRFGNGMSLLNLYGPTESTIIKLFYRIPETKDIESVTVPVGKPIEEADVLILDADDQPCLPEHVGELVILSRWIARGYLNPSQIDSRAFCYFSNNGRSSRAYRTGDLGRLLSNGNIELVGRKDRQVKILGYRIELDEIESVLSEHSAIRDVAVIVSNRSEDIQPDNSSVIVCYFSATQSGVSEAEIRTYAKERLLPHVFSLIRFSSLDRLPLTANGKVDRLKLESLSCRDDDRVFDPAPRPASFTVQQRISVMWEELLAIEAPDPGANFFELGGDSITAIRLLRKLREEVHPEIKLGDLYEYPSISQLSNRVEQLL